MQTYFFYIHIKGELTPTMKILEASSDGDASHRLVDSLRDWPKFASIELLEVYDEQQERLCRFSVDLNVLAH